MDEVLWGKPLRTTTVLLALLVAAQHLDSLKKGEIRCQSGFDHALFKRSSLGANRVIYGDYLQPACVSPFPALTWTSQRALANQVFPCLYAVNLE